MTNGHIFSFDQRSPSAYLVDARIYILDFGSIRFQNNYSQVARIPYYHRMIQHLKIQHSKMHIAGIWNIATNRRGGRAVYAGLKGVEVFPISG